jgi:hypothetical protein
VPIGPIQGILKVCEQDVLPTDRALTEYRRDDRPAVNVLKHDGIYNHDTGYVHGMKMGTTMSQLQFGTIVNVM